MISIAVPITGNNDEFVGVAVGMCSLDVSSASPFFANLIKLRVGRSGNAYLVDKNRMVIYATDTAYINTYFTAHPVVNQDFQNRVGVVRTLAEDGNMFAFPRLNSLLSSSGQNQLEGEALIQFLMARLGDFTGPGWEQEDDITMVAAKRLETDPG